ncbi:MAG: hypothetical protein EZS28_047358, partial [Streblomastix strix]
IAEVWKTKMMQQKSTYENTIAALKSQLEQYQAQ